MGTGKKVLAPRRSRDAGKRDASPTPMDIDESASAKAEAEQALLIKEPLDVGTKAPCIWRDGKHQECEIIERRKKPGTETYEYYVHYSTFNRRLDEWVTFDRFESTALRKAEKKRLSRKAASERAANASRAKNEKKRKDNKKRRASSVTVADGGGGNGAGGNGGGNGAGGGGVIVDGEKTKADKPVEEKQHEEATKVKNIQTIVVGPYGINAWYYSPFPAEYSGYSTLHICEFCLKFMRTRNALQRHCEHCILRHPPGLEIYRKDKISMFEVDGATNRIYCQNLCYIAKLFLDHKTLFYDVDPFWFYIMCEVDERGAHIVGYFSKEKFSEEDYNVACILTLPPYQRRGYGKFLIAFSYELSKQENRVGSPEKPLSDLGLLGYRSYWSQVLVELLRNERTSALSILQISEITMMKGEDIVSTLQALKLIQYYEGQHIIDLRRVSNMKMGSRGLPCDPKCIIWTPHSYGTGVQGLQSGQSSTAPSANRRR